MTMTHVELVETIVRQMSAEPNMAFIGVFLAVDPVTGKRHFIAASDIPPSQLRPLLAAIGGEDVLDLLQSWLIAARKSGLEIGKDVRVIQRPV